MTYYYRAYDKEGNIVEGSMLAEGVAEVRQKLAAQSQFLVSVSATGGSDTKAKLPLFRLPFLSPVSDRELALLAWQLHTMVTAGLQIVRSLELLTRQAQNRHMREALESVSRDVQRGDDFSLALTRRPRIFPPMFVSLVQTGELAGNLDVTLKRLAEYLDRNCDMKEKLIGALSYPVLLAGLTTVVIIFLLAFVMPRLAAVFEGAGVPLPWITRMLMAAGVFTQTHWMALLGTALGAVVAIYLFGRTTSGRMALDRMWMTAPLIGPIVSKTVMAQLSQSLAILQSSGVPLTTGLTIVEQNIGNAVVADLVRKMLASVSAGQSLSCELQKSDVVPEMVSTMVSVGEETGRLSDMLEHVAAMYVKDVDFAVVTFARVLEPAMLVVMAIIVGTVAASIYLPIADIATTVGR